MQIATHTAHRRDAVEVYRIRIELVRLIQHVHSGEYWIDAPANEHANEHAIGKNGTRQSEHVIKYHMLNGAVANTVVTIAGNWSFRYESTADKDAHEHACYQCWWTCNKHTHTHTRSLAQWWIPFSG